MTTLSIAEGQIHVEGVTVQVQTVCWYGPLRRRGPRVVLAPRGATEPRKNS